jgi:hypothetical protein
LATFGNVAKPEFGSDMIVVVKIDTRGVWLTIRGKGEASVE